MEREETGGYEGTGFFAVLEELRRTILVILLVVFAFSVLSFLFSTELLRLLLRLLGEKVVSYAPQEALIATLKLSLYAGFTLSFPVASFLLLRYLVSKISPGRERGVPLFFLISLLLFAAGVYLCYRVLLPAGIKFLLSFSTERLKSGISVGKFVDFCSFFLIASGIAHQAPLVSYILARAGILRPEAFRGKTRYAILVCFILAAVLTPTPDVYNMTLMAVPLLVLYFASFVVVKLAG
ncbi:MAG: preprotein translocase subunit TatC [Deltaproteobacteria bacterium]|nr:MAG: preprotein translocase subunit TatC [Deltaproteobacteria bacterium]